MKILIAPDKFKGSLTAGEVIAAVRAGIIRARPDATVVAQPLADGGEGSLDIIRATRPVHEHRLKVTGPLRRPVDASYLLGEGVAYVETAAACGLQHVPPRRRDPRYTTTIGVGQLIEDALARGAREVVLYLGGSATNDGGAGMAAALGYRFFSDRGHDFVPAGNSLGYVQRIDREEVATAIGETKFVCICDVNNPLLGPAGATHTYAAQKGAGAEDLSVLEEHMTHFSGLVEKTFGVPGLRETPGVGAAGGLAYGCRAFLNADLRSGADWVAELLTEGGLLDGVDLVITGEGSIDAQTARGKVVAAVARAARARGIRTLALAGRSVLTDPLEQLPGVTALRAIMDLPGMTERRALDNAGELLAGITEAYLRKRFPR